MEAKLRCRECYQLPRGAEEDGIAVGARAGMNPSDDTFPPASPVEGVDVVVDLVRRMVIRVAGTNRADKEEVDALSE